METIKKRVMSIRNMTYVPKEGKPNAGIKTEACMVCLLDIPDEFYMNGHQSASLIGMVGRVKRYAIGETHPWKKVDINGVSTPVVLTEPYQELADFTTEENLNEALASQDRIDALDLKGRW